MKIYVASSWRNIDVDDVIIFLRDKNHEVYNFKESGFKWSDIDPDWKNWNKQKFASCLYHPIAVRGFNRDFEAMKWAEVFIGVEPFGRSASMEMGWAVGAGKKTILLLSDKSEPELMSKMFDYRCCDLIEVLRVLEEL